MHTNSCERGHNRWQLLFTWWGGAAQATSSSVFAPLARKRLPTAPFVTWCATVAGLPTHLLTSWTSEVLVIASSIAFVRLLSFPTTFSSPYSPSISRHFSLGECERGLANIRCVPHRPCRNAERLTVLTSRHVWFGLCTSLHLP